MVNPVPRPPSWHSGHRSALWMTDISAVHAVETTIEKFGGVALPGEVPVRADSGGGESEPGP